MKKQTSLMTTLIILATPANVAATSYVGLYCDIESAETDDGRKVTGECYMYSEKYGELEGAETEDGESVSGECYRYSERYAELDGASTDSGESVSGECYFYNTPSRNR